MSFVGLVSNQPRCWVFDGNCLGRGCFEPPNMRGRKAVDRRCRTEATKGCPHPRMRYNTHTELERKADGWRFLCVTRSNGIKHYRERLKGA